MNQELAKTLAVLKELVGRVNEAIPLDQLSAATIRSHPALAQIDACLTGIWHWDQSLRPLLDDVLMGRRIPIADVPPQLSTFFHQTYLPNRERLLAAWFWEFDTGSSATPAPGFGPIEAETTVKETLDVALSVYADKLENGDFGESAPEGVVEARKLIDSEMFQPDL